MGCLFFMMVVVLISQFSGSQLDSMLLLGWLSCSVTVIMFGSPLSTMVSEFISLSRTIPELEFLFSSTHKLKNVRLYEISCIALLFHHCHNVWIACLNYGELVTFRTIWARVVNYFSNHIYITTIIYDRTLCYNPC